MTTFDSTQYIQELENYLGDDEPLAVLQTTLTLLPALVGDLDEATLTRQPAPGEWSPWQVVLHLADTEWVYGVRVRLTVAQERPVLVGYDQDAWVTRFGSLDKDIHETLARFRLLREANLRVYHALNEAELQRIGLHTERGEETVEHIIRALGGHDRLHLEQIKRALA